MVQQRRDRQLHRRGVATRVADALLARVTGPGEFGQTVIPALVEAMIRGQVHQHGVGCVGVDCRHDFGGFAIGQREDHCVHALVRHLFMTQVFVSQFAAEALDLRADGLAREFPRRDEAQLQGRMPGDQADQFGAGMASGAHDAD